MALLVKCFRYKKEELNFFPRTHIKAGCATHTKPPTAGEVDTGQSLGLAGPHYLASPAISAESRFSKKLCLKR